MNRTEYLTTRWVVWLIWVGFLFFNIVVWYDTKDSFYVFYIGLGIGVIFIMLADNLLFGSFERLTNSYEKLKTALLRLINTLKESLKLKDNLIKELEEKLEEKIIR